MSNEPVIVRMKNVRAMRLGRDGLCSKGLRRWFAQHDLDWNDFIANGIPAEKLDEIGDPVARQVADIAREEASSGQQ